MRSEQSLRVGVGPEAFSAQVIDTQRISEVGIAKICCMTSEDQVANVRE